jgi:hypothetical protein
MDGFGDLYRIYERVTGILVLVTFTFYLWRCIRAGEFLSLDQYWDYTVALLRLIFK